MVNKRILITALVLVATALSLAACAPPTPVPASHWRLSGEENALQIGIEDNGREVIIHEGEALILTLDSSPTAGYSWQLGEFDEEILRRTYHDYVLRGHVPIKEFWYFQSLSTGDTTLRLEYVLSEREGTGAVEIFTIQVVVQPASASLFDFSLWKLKEKSKPPLAIPSFNIMYGRRGGPTGISEKWDIISGGWGDGASVIGYDTFGGERGGIFAGGGVDAQAAADLWMLIVEEDFFSLDTFKQISYIPPGISSDCLRYEIVVRAGTVMQRVIYATDCADAPEGLRRIIEELDTLVSSVDGP